MFKTDYDQKSISLVIDDCKRFLKENVEVHGYKAQKFMQSLSEAQSFSVSDKLITALYKSAMNKYTLIDFGTIPKSKGDFDKLERVKDLEETLELINEITGKKLEEVEIINKTIQILRSYKKEFTLGFINDIQIVQMIYNTIVLSIYTAISLLMNVAIDFIRTPNGSLENSRNIQKSTDKRYSIIISNLEAFNKSASNGDLTKLLNNTVKKENFIGSIGATSFFLSSGAISAGIIVAACIVIIPIIRTLIFLAYNLRMNISDFFKQQAEFLEMNITELKSSNGNSKVIKKQQKQMDRLLKYANKFEVEFNKAEKKANKDLSVKVNTDNIRDSLIQSSDDQPSFGLM